jgi:hypothetical protein
LAGLLGLLLLNGTATAAIIDFEELTLGATQNTPNPSVIESGGFNFESDPGTYFIVTDSSTAAGNGLAWGPTLTTAVSNTSGALFSLQSVHLSSVSSPTAPITIVGYADDGRVLTRQATHLDGISSGATITLGGGWTGLERVEFQGNEAHTHIGNVMDNLAVTVVPVPAAIWLFLSGLAALGIKFRRS